MTIPNMQALITEWRRHPAPTAIHEALVSSPTSRALAVSLYPVADELNLPPATLELLIQLCRDDPMLATIIDFLVACVVEPEPPPTPPAVDQVVTLVDGRLDRDGFVVVLADALIETLSEADEEIPAVVARFAALCVELADCINHPAYAPIYLLRYRLHPLGGGSAQDLDQCRRLAGQMPPADRANLLIQVLAEACNLPDDELARSVAREATPLASWLGDDVEALALLHGWRTIDLAASDVVAAIDHLTAVMVQTPQLALDRALDDLWFETILGHATELAMAERPSNEIRRFVELIADHPDWWSEHGMRWAAVLLITRFFISVNEPATAVMWLDRASPQETGDVDVDAEFAMLRTVAALHLGRTVEAVQLLRQSASLVRQSAVAEHQVQWIEIARAVARVNRDATAQAELESILEQTLGPLTESEAASVGYGDDIDVVQAFHGQLMSLSDCVISHTATPHDLETARGMLSRIPAASPQLEFGAHFLVAALELNLGHREAAIESLNRMRETSRDQHAAPLGGMNLAGFDLALRVTQVLLDLQDLGASDAVLKRLCQLRDVEAENDRDLTASLLSHILMFLHKQRGDHESVIREAICAMGFHTRRIASLPDAAERAALQQDLQDLADHCFTAAVAGGRDQTAAELLEILRAQPIPLARNTPQDSERSLAHLAARMLSNDASAQIIALTGTWPSVTASPPQAGRENDPDEVSALLLSGIPTILLPWGAALGDRLRDPNVRTVVRLEVLRGEGLSDERCF